MIQKKSKSNLVTLSWYIKKWGGIEKESCLNAPFSANFNAFVKSISVIILVLFFKEILQGTETFYYQELQSTVSWELYVEVFSCAYFYFVTFFALIKKCTFNNVNIQLRKMTMASLLDKPHVNEVTLIEQTSYYQG